MRDKPQNATISFQKIVVITSLILFTIKIFAWYLTNSVAILTDALESIINVVAGAFTLYSLYVSAQPEDHNHPYGHGKIEFIAAGIEGSMIVCAGIYIFYEAISNLIEQNFQIQQLNYGVILIGITGGANFLLGYNAIKKGKKHKSLPLIAGGKHLLSDCYSSLALIIGLVLVMITKQLWLDSVIAMIFGSIIVYTGVKIVREAVAGIMDEADDDLLQELIDVLNNDRNEHWIDIHNIRFIKYGSKLHLDCHLTVPWYLNLRDVHQYYVELRDLTKAHFGDQIELFVHLDDCVPESCAICTIDNCTKRCVPFTEKLTWNIGNTTQIQRHSLELDQ